MVHSAEDEPLISRNFTPHEPVTLFFFLKKEKVTKPHDVRGYTDSLCSKCPKYPKYPAGRNSFFDDYGCSWQIDRKILNKKDLFSRL